MSGWRVRGFTLLELMVVLVLVSLTTALVVPRLSGSLTKLSARTAAKKVAAGLRYIRSRAVAEKQVYGAIFDFTARQIRVGPVGDRTSSKNDAALPQDDTRIYTLEEGVGIAWAESVEGERVGRGTFTIFFYPSGASSGGRVAFIDEAGRTYGLVADIITGAVRISEEGTGS